MHTAKAFTQKKSPSAPCVAIVGGGFSGALAAAQLLRGATQRQRPLHVVVIEAAPVFGEGAAYRTKDPRHLLNVPASRMSAWPDDPEHFLRWAQRADPSVKPYDFLPRRQYGEYVRSAVIDVARDVAPNITIEILHDVAQSIERSNGAWVVRGLQTVQANAVVLATGHRPPADPINRWVGSRARFIADPWSVEAFAAIGPDEPVVLLGSGLTAIDALLSITREERSAPVVAVSRHGMLPRAHAEGPVAPRDLTDWVTKLLAAPAGLTSRTLLQAFRQEITAQDADWRAFVDGLRPHTKTLWAALSKAEARRFIQHLRPFWEVHRHRAAPSVGRLVQEHVAAGSFRVMSGRVLSAEGNGRTVSVQVKNRCNGKRETLRTGWVINCTGPGDTRSGVAPVLGSLIDGGHLQTDAHGLGVLTGSGGVAIGTDGPCNNLLVLGTLCKPRLWESTAVPELRVQAAEAAALILGQL